MNRYTKYIQKSDRDMYECAHTISIEGRHVALWVKPQHFQISKFPKVNYYCDFNFHWKSFNPFRNDAKLQTICIVALINTSHEMYLTLILKRNNLRLT